MSEKESNQKGIEWISRTIAIILMILVPGLIGMFLDGRFETSFFTPTAIILGMIAAMGMLLLLARELTPKARGEAIPFEDNDDKDAWDDDTNETSK